MRDETFLQNTDRGIFPEGSLYAKGVSFKITGEQRNRAQRLVGKLGERLCPGDAKQCYCQPVACEPKVQTSWTVKQHDNGWVVVNPDGEVRGYYAGHNSEDIARRTAQRLTK